MKVLSQKKKLVILCFFISVFMFAGTQLTPMIADDFNYCYNWATDERIHGIVDIFHSMMWHYMTANGRFLSHMFVQIFLYYPRILFSTVNALVASGVVVLIYQYMSVPAKGDGLFGTVIFIACLVLFLPAFGQVFFWLDGACNYHWAIFLLLLYLFPFYVSFFSKPLAVNNFVKVIFILEAVIAGSYSENGSLAFGFISFLILVYLVKKNGFKNVQPFLYFMFLAALAGYLFLALSPAVWDNRIKSNFFSEMIQGIFSTVGKMITQYYLILLAVLVSAFLIILLIKKFNKVFIFILKYGAVFLFAIALLYTAPDFTGSNIIELFKTAVSHSAWNLILISILFYYLFLYILLNKSEVHLITLGCFFFAAGVLSIAIFAVARYMPARSTYVYVVLLSVFVSLVGILLKDKIMHSVTLKVIISFLSLCAVLAAYVGAGDIINVFSESLDRNNAIMMAKENNLDYLEISPYNPETKYSAQYGLSDVIPEFDWPNSVMSDYYGIKTIVGTENN